MKQAFTLIELLVVIAIIAILAAILFPVFAQAKDAAKKTASISNVKQNATSITLYSTDYEDVLPIAYPCQPDGLVRSYMAGTIQPAYVPGDIRPDIAYQMDVDWANSTNPYRKNYQLLAVAGAPFTTINFGATATKSPEVVSLSMNGLLSTYSNSEMSSPSSVPLVWPTMGKYGYKGYAYTNPMLDCGAPNTLAARAGMICRFNPSGKPNPATVGDYGGVIIRFTFGADAASALPKTNWIHGAGTVIARADTSAKFYKIGAGRTGSPNTNYYTDPWNAYLGDNGLPTGDAWYETVSDNTTAYPFFFAPDRDQ